jgi:hypothetical protein
VPLDSTLTLFWASLGISAAAVGLFLWLVRDDRGRKPEAGSRKPNEESKSRAPAESSDL